MVLVLKPVAVVDSVVVVVVAKPQGGVSTPPTTPLLALALVRSLARA